MNALDEHSIYFPPEEYERFRKARHLVHRGWSASQSRKGHNEIAEGPASIAGLMVGDQLSKIDTVSLQDWSLGQIRSALKRQRYRHHSRSSSLLAVSNYSRRR